MNALLSLQIMGGPVPVALLICSLVLVIFLLWRRPTSRWLLTAAIGVIGGVVIGLAFFCYADLSRIFEIALPPEVGWWTAAALGGIGLAIASLWKTTWWRASIAAVAVLVFAATGGVQVNAAFGLDGTVGQVLGITVPQPIALPSPHPLPSTTGPNTVLPLYQTWSPPAGMPSAGRRGTVTIPATISGFHARPAGLYLPPAALVKHPPALPLLVMMMGYPGNPDPTRIALVMDAFAARHHGLAPIVVVADQIGPGRDPACADSRGRGNAETYVTRDVVSWAQTHLNVRRDPGSLVIAGYSNGATCAVKYAAEEPARFRRVLAVSPELFPGSDYAPSIIAAVYGGDRAAWQAAKPVSILDAHRGQAAYRGVEAVITTGALDEQFGPGTRALAAAARGAGVDVRLLTIPGVAHVGDNLFDGLTAGFAQLAPSLGLAAPGGAG
ncbi:MAG: prolyl oligopeptidase family serine peptidase [Microbacterium sp.]|uniref:alpha/beta hydrolase n=1 Tax=Microbacterium sp. TaxID=51671 RepID=UPI001AD2006E|nr:alpha/beta hydrolase-fold protein [Microbacterium sp.]MBN9152968.1 prolyl oligopeptidase family serine peptidase [Microbacterium sp.]